MCPVFKHRTKSFSYENFNACVPPNCLSPSQAWNVLALDGSNWQKIDLFNFQTDIEVRTVFLREER